MTSLSSMILTRFRLAIFVGAACGLIVRDAVAADDTPKLPHKGVMGSTSPVCPQDGRWAALGGSVASGSIGTVTVWDTRTGKLMSKLKPHIGITTDVQFSPDGQWLVSVGLDTVCRVWKVHPKPVPKIGLLSLEGTVQHYTLAMPVGAGQFAPGGRIRLAVAPSGREFASAAQYVATDVTPIEYSRDCHQSIKIWPMPSGIASPDNQPDPDDEPHPGPGPKPRLTIPVSQCVSMLVYSPDGKTLVAGLCQFVETGSRSRPVVQFFDAETGTLRSTWKLTDDEPHNGGMGGRLAFSPDGEHLAVCFDHKPTVSVWHVATEKVVWSHKIRNGWQDVAFSPDGTMLAVGAKHQEVQLWSFPECKLISVGVTPSVFGTNVAFARGGSTLLTTWEGDAIEQWSVEELVAKKRWGLDQKLYRTVGETRQPLVVP